MNSSLAIYGLLLGGVVVEMLGTSFLEKSEGLARLLPAVLGICFYGASFLMWTYLLNSLPMGVLYALWSGLGIVVVGVVGFVFNKQVLDLPAMLGMGLILAGVVLIYLYSKSVPS